MEQGEALRSLKEHPGWKTIEQWLVQRAFHDWVDPRSFKDKEGWMWAELNLFHSADVARQLMDEVNNTITQAEYLRKKEQGELDASKFEAYWNKVKSYIDKGGQDNG